MPENSVEPDDEVLLQKANSQHLPFLYQLMYNNMEKMSEHLEELGTKVRGTYDSRLASHSPFQGKDH